MGLFFKLAPYLPMRVLYIGAWLLYLVVFYLVCYRRKETEENLRRAFPDWSAARVGKTCKLVYRNLAEVAVETIKLRVMSKEAIKEPVQLIGTEKLTWNGQSPVIIAGAHQGNWEWLFQRIVLHNPHDVYGVYKPLHNRAVDGFIKEVRTRFGTEMVAYRDLGRQAIRYRQCSCIMMGDQSPSSLKGAVWVRFFNRETAFYSGLARLSSMFNLPVFYVSIKRVRRGSYRAELEFLGVATKGDEEAFTQLYASRIEQAITAQPETWMWTHRRWKRSESA